MSINRCACAGSQRNAQKTCGRRKWQPQGRGCAARFVQQKTRKSARDQFRACRARLPTRRSSTPARSGRAPRSRELRAPANEGVLSPRDHTQVSPPETYIFLFFFAIFVIIICNLLEISENPLSPHTRGVMGSTVSWCRVIWQSARRAGSRARTRGHKSEARRAANTSELDLLHSKAWSGDRAA